jgi:hypothetical protein
MSEPMQKIICPKQAKKSSKIIRAGIFGIFVLVWREKSGINGVTAGVAQR